MHRCSGFVVAVCLVLVVAAPAAAKQGESPPEPVAVAGSGPGVAPRAPAWVRAGVARIHDGAIEDGGSQSSASRSLQARKRVAWVGCRDVWAYRGYDHAFGYNLFRYYQQVSWCSNGFSIYSWSRFRWAELNGPGWAFDGHVGSSLGGTATEKRAWTQGSFHACYSGWCDYKVPWVNIEVNVDGGWSANTGG
jgi:hypothetical protein